METMAHDRHAGHSAAMFRDRFWLSLALTIPVVLWSPDPQEWLGYAAPTFPGSDLIPPVLGTIVFVYGGLVFLRAARGELADRRPGMMTLISLAISVAFATSLAATLGLFDVEVWWELSTLIVVMLLGHWLEMRSIAQARGALAALADLLPDTAERVADDGAIEAIPATDLRVDDLVLVRPGGRVPADGVVADGRADADESMLTGESRPVAKEPGAPVIAGTVVAGGSLRVRVTAVGEGTALSGIVRLVEAAQASASHAQALADRAAAVLFYVALAAGGVTLGYSCRATRRRPSSASARAARPSRWSATASTTRQPSRPQTSGSPSGRARTSPSSRPGSMVQNLAWATGYNLVAIPVAAGILTPLGIDLPMAVGAIAMSASTVIVAANAQLLRRLRLAPVPVAADGTLVGRSVMMPG